MSPILACPVCSSVRARVIRRPLPIQGKRSGKWLLVADGFCDHIQVFERWNLSDDPEPIITFWNERARGLAAELSTKRGHTPEQAAEFLEALWPKNYRQHGTHT